MDNSFAGCTVFEVDSNTFSKIRTFKDRYHSFKTYIDEEESLAAIREFAKKNPSKSIVVKDKQTGSFKFLKKGKDYKL